ncbi:chorismate mutase [Romboutsia sp.]|uniref:chorismate mutase n=1 Tax=Romboutsia sp. TaxID=1965302 RepID=UPI002C291AC1|nr:chorismate mutase [Romboutsia sp.]HSQ89482.1 chorismate mutase [Romboutsia sp.]
MKVLAIRGATTVVSNNKEDILNESAKLIQTIIIENLLDLDDIISMCFTMTNDLDKVYPSVAVREILNITDIPMLNFEEKYIEGSLRMCIRVIMYVNSEKSKKDIKHIYLNDSKDLRKDLVEIQL